MQIALLSEKHEKFFQKVILFFFISFCISSLIFPPLFIKKIAFLFFFIAVGAYNWFFKVKGFLILNGYLLFFIFAIFLLQGFKNNASLELGLQYLLSLSLLFFVGTFSRLKFDFDKFIVYIGCFLTFFVIYLSLTYFEDFVSVSLPFGKLFLNFYIDNELGYLGFRQFGYFKPPMFHFVSSPFLVVSFLLGIILLIERKKKVFAFCSLFVFLGVLLSGSRSMVLISLIGAFAIFFIYCSFKIKILMMLLSFFLILSFGFFLVNSDILASVFSLQETSNRTKYGHFLSFLDSFNNENVFYGSGLASNYYSMGVRKFIPQTEIMILDFFRYFGVLISFFVIFIFIFPIKYIFLKRKLSFCSKSLHFDSRFFVFLCYFFMSFSNPVLLTSVGMTVVFWFWVSRINDLKMNID